ncbi:type I methionyl aminopeptidase [candidate division WOR-1 bacterium RIFOXYB2_FULL_42_35]|uniref:Methionine aminopeptidase n=1 Tax=candidate division WOR-1 bacterium RIFOXYC2_FULL_41_25 TaxID=1802586 RepID=A0A1F4TMF6_UNCSA|nr:MAG: type I methionyl aminopeptidase [candidate division WOR-1 bacterium RIFOXYA2_FULL_41_14]OGC23874.1 MAG: type I methionyl aminopeptidase [candidate division WOR-1 bacterium RIFOXYB2_FULL_42_35]OGC33749.1 MAG: type I methionyl aminopeptidase [candidate division WOR-1 bacterium RIFOXYC2_FULL_41_25]OGC42497.1 MAG: type I methionyl aminopeptidase [candidate division WOR-1 bacterium RIFOXYD2_FULL_41_8]
MSQILIKSLDEIEKVKKACRIVAKVLAAVGKKVKAGISTEDLDKIADELIRKQGAEPVFIGYRGYRHATCISVNEEIVHGIPGKKILQEGDIVSLDVGAKIGGYCGDTAATFPVGKISRKAARLVRFCKSALQAGIRQARAGNHLGDISAAVKNVADQAGYSVVRELYGHGIGKDLHEEPLIPNFGNPGEGPKLRAGMVLAIEPMLNIGGWKIRTLSDGWTVVTADQSLSSHFEHTILITEKGPEILTLRGNE